MAGSGINGMATAIGLLGGAGVLGDDADQPELFADADDAPSALPPARSGPQGGRPKGARNRSTEEWRRYLSSRYQSPLIGCAETWSRSAEDLARELHLTREVSHLATGQEALKTIAKYTAEGDFRGNVYVVWDLEKAFRLQQEARAAALPYWHQKLPQAVEISTPPKRGVFLFGEMPVGPTGEGDQALPLPPLEPAFEIKRNQDVSEAEIVKSDSAQSDDFTNALSFKDET